MFGLLPKNLQFFDCFEKAAKNAVRTAELLAESSKADRPRRQELAVEIREAEHFGDRTTHETLNRLERTYITPIDRDDIHRLISKIDDVVDMIDAVAQRMIFYKIDEVSPEFQNQCAVLVKAASAMNDAVCGLRFIKQRRGHNGVRIEQYIIAVHQHEEEADAIHHQFLGRLFECGLDAFQVIKWKELYELVEQATDFCDDVACIVHGIVLKNV
ncbi:MAG: DUF47 family protein [Planctomycetia bacterium]|nr:DUF47 family protein [Planctomycetia bacterium]